MKSEHFVVVTLYGSTNKVVFRDSYAQEKVYINTTKSITYCGRTLVEASGLNPASDLLSGEQLVNQEKMAGIHIDTNV